VGSHRTALKASLKVALAAAMLLLPAPAAAGPLDRWAPQIALASSRFGIPPGWIRRVMRVESGGKTHLHGRPVVSSAGAMGLMQLMPSTWRDMRLALGLGPDPFDPTENILAGTAYLRLMYDRFGYPGLFAAYNAGPRRFAAFLAGARPLPVETRAYVAALAPAALPPSALAFKRPAPLFALGRAESRPPRPPFAQIRSGGLFVALDEGARDGRSGEGRLR